MRMMRFSRIKSLPVLLVVLVVLTTTRVVHATGNFRWYCELKNEAIVDLKWDSDKKSYVVSNDDHDGRVRTRDLLAKDESTTYGDIDDDDDDSLPFSFLLRGGDQQEVQNAIAAVSSHRRRVQDNDNSTTTEAVTTSSSSTPTAIPDMIQARRCPCWNPSGLQSKDFYCPLPRTHCGLGAYWTTVNKTSITGASLVYNDPGCVDIKRQRSFARNVWPIVTVWYLAMFLCLCLTSPGRHAMGFCVSKIWPGFNVIATNRIIRQNPDGANRTVFRVLASEAAEMGTGDAADVAARRRSATNRLISFAGFEVTFNLPQQDSAGEEYLLRTKTYRYGDKKEDDGDDDDDRDICEDKDKDKEVLEASHNNTLEQAASLNDSDSNDDKKPEASEGSNTNMDNTDGACEDNEAGLQEAAAADDSSQAELVSCSICHLEIEEGDRVGDLPCGHVMHIECLKAWIARRNVCPLCLTENIATPRQPQTTPPAAEEESSPQQQARVAEEHSPSWLDRPLPGLVATGD